MKALNSNIISCYTYCLINNNCIQKCIKKYLVIITEFWFFSFVGDELRLSLFRDKVFQGVFDSLNNESGLKILKLGNNNIHSLSAFCFEYLKNLERLELNNNPLLVIDQNTEISLGHLTHLQVNLCATPPTRRQTVFPMRSGIFNFSIWTWEIQVYRTSPRECFLGFPASKRCS